MRFHKAITKRTDFYAEIGYEHSKTSVPIFDVTLSGIDNIKNSKDNLIASIGVRTAFTKKFELITELKYVNRGYPYYSRFESLDSNVFENTFGNKDINLSFMELYKFNDKNSLKFGLDGSFGFTMGWRYNWK